MESCLMTARTAVPAAAVWLMTTPTRSPTACREKNSGSAESTVSSVWTLMRRPIRPETTAEYHVLK